MQNQAALLVMGGLLLAGAYFMVHPQKRCPWATPIEREDARVCASIPGDESGALNDKCLKRLGYVSTCK